MTGYEIISKSIASLGFTQQEIEINDSISAAFFLILDEVLYTSSGDSKKPQSLGEEINVDGRVMNTVVLGVAAKIAATLGDTAQQAFFAQSYNESLRSFSKADTVQDTVPFAKGC